MSLEVIQQETVIEIQPTPKIIEILGGLPGRPGDKGAPGPPGQSYARRFDLVGSITYTGRSAPGTADDAESWTIFKTTYSTSGLLISTATATDVAWTDRLTATYT